MRVVFDTNIFISALVIPGSLAEKALSRIIEKMLRLKEYMGIKIESLRNYLES